MKKQNLLTGIIGGVLGFVGMIVSLVQGKSPAKSGAARSGGAGPGEKKRPETKGGGGKGKGEHLAIVKKKAHNRQTAAKSATPAKIAKKSLSAAPAKTTEKAASATPAKIAKNIEANAPEKA